MKASELIAEGKRLARPCIYLRDKGAGRPVAAWGGSSPVAAPTDAERHWITLDCSLLPEELELSGIASVFAGRVGAFVVNPSTPFSCDASSTALFAEPGLSLPPIDAVFRFGSPAVQAWLAENKWEPAWGYNDNFSDRATADAYAAEFQAQYPLYTGDAHAVVGGWHFTWPDDDWEQRLSDVLLLCTFADCEPWVEVWSHEGVFEVVERVT
ncbi:MAG: hypothetical protein R3B13_16790 [Polyangiaceae bacterium]